MLCLLMGYCSLTDALAMELTLPQDVQEVCHDWFPGGGTGTLPLAHAQRLDRC